MLRLSSVSSGLRSDLDPFPGWVINPGLEALGSIVLWQLLRAVPKPEVLWWHP